ncbi:hypothetical protein EMCRGX_G016351 [Ephydatia muelleri]
MALRCNIHHQQNAVAIFQPFAAAEHTWLSYLENTTNATVKNVKPEQICTGTEMVWEQVYEKKRRVQVAAKGETYKRVWLEECTEKTVQLKGLS